MVLTYSIAAFAPLVGAICAGFFGKQLGRTSTHRITIAMMIVSAIAAVLVLNHHVLSGNAAVEHRLYEWANIGNMSIEVGFYVDNLTAIMMCVVTSVSLMVHIYTIGYMQEDPGYQRFFSYISLFTFSMLMLVMSNNFMQLFFGWEAVGLVSYLLIGFWHTKPTAVFANMKAFLVNRVGDFGFLLGIGIVLIYFGSLNYGEVFAQIIGHGDHAHGSNHQPALTMPLFGQTLSVFTVAGILLFIGAMGKSAQVPLHVWLPDSMEGPTPISALIHAATMVTAGIFMVARMSPIFEQSPTALSFILIIGATTALFMGILGIIQNDIKRVIAYSTLSQLGYMTVALGVSAYSAAVFHLMTHAFFKALLFLAAGSVIIAMHHKQDIWEMGGLWKKMPITWITSLIGTLALIGFPFFAGFYSKDAIIEAAKASEIAGSGYAYFAVLAGVFITSFYSFRLYFVVFHGKPRMDKETESHIHETPWVVTLPLVLLAIPSIIIGAMTIKALLFGDVFKDVIYLDHARHTLHHLEEHFHDWKSFALHGFETMPFMLALAGFISAFLLYGINPEFGRKFGARLKAAPVTSTIYKILDNKYGFDWFNQYVLSSSAVRLGKGLWQGFDSKVIDGWLVNGSAKAVGQLSGLVSKLQSGLLYHYAFAMIVGLVLGLSWLLIK